MATADRARARPGYRVRIVYTEPGFRRRNPHAPPEYQFVYAGVAAKTEEEAIRLVRQRFWELTGQSWVHWQRYLKAVSVVGWAEHPERNDGEWF
jgi:hypothetical protein